MFVSVSRGQSIVKGESLSLRGIGGEKYRLADIRMASSSSDPTKDPSFDKFYEELKKV